MASQSAGDKIEFFGVVDDEGIERHPDTGLRVVKSHPHYGHTATVLDVTADETVYTCTCGAEWSVPAEFRS